MRCLHHAAGALLLVWAGVLLADDPPATPPGPTTSVSDDYQARMDELNRRARERAGSREQEAMDEVRKLREENLRLRNALESMAVIARRRSGYDGPLDARGIVASFERVRAAGSNQAAARDEEARRAAADAAAGGETFTREIGNVTLGGGSMTFSIREDGRFVSHNIFVRDVNRIDSVFLLGDREQLMAVRELTTKLIADMDRRSER